MVLQKQDGAEASRQEADHYRGKTGHCADLEAAVLGHNQEVEMVQERVLILLRMLLGLVHLPCTVVEVPRFETFGLLAIDDAGLD